MAMYMVCTFHDTIKMVDDPPDCMEQTGLIRSSSKMLTVETSEIGEDVSLAGWLLP